VEQSLVAASLLIDEYVDEALLFQVFLGFAERATFFGGLGKLNDPVASIIVTASTCDGDHVTPP